MLQQKKQICLNVMKKQKASAKKQKTSANKSIKKNQLNFIIEKYNNQNKKFSG